MRIALFEIEKWEEDYFKEKLKGHTLIFNSKPITVRSAAKYGDSEVLVVFIGSKVTKSIMDKMPKLKFIATMSTGFDHIDIEEAKNRNIKISTVPAYGQNTVAEHAFTLLQALNRNIVEAVTRTRQGIFDYTGLMGVDLEGKTIGIVGTGRIGQYMIRYATAFGMKVLAYDPFPKKELVKELGFKYVSLNMLYSKSDFLSIHVPLVEGTRHMLNKESFAKMKKGIKIINTSRGPIINTEDLIEALDKKIVGGCALDVLEAENDFKQEAKMTTLLKLNRKKLKLVVEDHALIHRQNVIVTPHEAFYTKEAVTRILDTTVKNIKGHSGKRYKNRIA